jgi:hypothetical protein
MSLSFPAFPIPETFLVYPTRPAERTDPAFPAFLEALSQFFQDLHQQKTDTHQYFKAVDFCFQDSHQEGLLQNDCTEVGAQAMASVINNIAPPMICDYVWDNNLQHWTVRMIPV